MKWEIGFSKEAEKFLKRENLRSETIGEIVNFLKRLRGNQFQ
jgi:hypothetical protein